MRFNKIRVMFSGELCRDSGIETFTSRTAIMFDVYAVVPVISELQL